MSKILVVLGAGASYDVANRSVRVNDSEWRPPLASELFDGSRFEVLLSTYRGARQVASSLAELTGESLESALARYARGSDLQKQLFREIPPYLRDVLYRCSKNYVPHPATYSALLNRLIVENANEVMFAVLNYDDLLEQALTTLDPATYNFDDVSLTALDSYVRLGRAANVVKVHGSIDWFRPIGLRHDRSWDETVQSFDFNQPAESIIKRDVGGTVRGAEYGNRWLYPVLTAPLAEKTDSDLLCSLAHQEQLLSFTHSASRFLFIGTSGLDDDLLSLIAQGMPPFGRALVVGPDTQRTVDSVRNLKKRLPRLSQYERIEDGELWTAEKGFRDFVGSDALTKFLSAAFFD